MSTKELFFVIFEAHMDYTEKQISSDIKFKGRIVTLRVDDAELCNGKLVKREVVEHPGGVGVLPLDGEGFCYMVRQFRYPFGRQFLEIPAGKLEYGEEHYPCAVRELSEETGLSAGSMIYLGACATSPGFSSEVLHIYLAKDLSFGDMHPDENEFLNVEKYRFEDIYEMVMNGEIDDAKTIIAVLKTAEYLKRKS